MTTKKPPASKKAGGEAVAEVKGTVGAPAVAQAALDAAGQEAILARLCDGETMTGIASSLGVSFGSLQTWIESIPERSARAREARALAARRWDEMAEAGILRASDTFELAKAKEHAHHLRWRATKIAPAYSDRQAVELTGKDGGPVQLLADTPEAREARIAELLAQRERLLGK
jgi:hypothetical protein